MDERRIRRALRSARALLPAAAIGAALALGAGSASAQNDAAEYFNHLTCFKTKADQKLKGSADLETLLAGIGGFVYDESCTVKKVSHVCVLAHKSNAQGQIKKDPVTIQEGAAAASQFAQICYKLKCKEKPSAELQLRDQFAGYELTKLKPDLLCGPAVDLCADSTRTVYGGGPNAGGSGGSCRQFTSQGECEMAWVAHHPSNSAALVPQQCEWDGVDCVGANHQGVANSCVTCANPALSQVLSCGDSSGTDEGTCEAGYVIGGTGPTSCLWNANSTECAPCGLTRELDLPNSTTPPCVNSCRGG